MRFVSFTGPNVNLSGLEDDTFNPFGLLRHFMSERTLKPGILLKQKYVVHLPNAAALKGIEIFPMMEWILDRGNYIFPIIKELYAEWDIEQLRSLKDNHGKPIIYPIEEITIQSLFRNISSLRDFYAFEQHVKTANENRGREVPKEWYEFPVFYFSNASAIYGPEDVIPYPSYTEKLDYELEVACVIGKAGRDIPAEKAEEHIFGYMIYNDWSARDIQRKEMAVGLGPAKGKDFANSFGPYLVTPDELEDRHAGRPGVYDLEMIARVNGIERSRGNWKDLHWSFGEMIERASQDVQLAPGDVIGSGTVGTGCLLEVTKGEGPWLEPGDIIELEIERLGILRNIVGEKKKKSI